MIPVMSKPDGPAKTSHDWTAVAGMLSHAVQLPERASVLALGDVPPFVIGPWTLRGRVDVVQPSSSAGSALNEAVPSARILRTDIKSALPFLTDYDLVVSADPVDVRGAWSWVETFDTIERLMRGATAGVLLARFPRTALGCLSSEGGKTDPSRPRSAGQLARLVHPSAQVMALEDAATHEGAVAYPLHDVASHAVAAAVLTRVSPGGALPLNACADVVVRIEDGSMALQSPNAVVLHDLPDLGVFSSDYRIHRLDAPPGAPLEGPTHAEPLQLGLFKALILEDLGRASTMVQAYLEGPSAPMDRCVYFEETSTLGTITPFSAVTDQEGEVASLLAEFCASDVNTAGWDTANLFARLTARSPGSQLGRHA